MTSSPRPGGSQSVPLETKDDAAHPAPRPASEYVFISYSHADRDFVVRLIADLKVRGVNCWVDSDKSRLKPGTADWDQAVRDAIRSSSAVLLVASRNSRQSQFVKSEVAVAKMYQRPLYPIWTTGEHWIDCVPLELSVTQFIDARDERYEAALADIVEELGSTTSAPDPVPPIPAVVASEPDVRSRNPYKGLRAFGEEDASDFFGRGQDIDSLVEMLQQTLVSGAEGFCRLLVVVGPSGSGKSSMVMAGLVPRLKAGAIPGSDSWVYLNPVLPGSRPLEVLTIALSDKLDRSMSSVREDLDDESSRGLHLLASRLVKRQDARVVLLIDQFEELFTQTDDEGERQHLIALLVAAVTETRGPTVAILTLRADFYHQVMKYPELWRLVATRTHYVSPMSVDDLRDVIELPAKLPTSRLSFEEDLVGDLLFEVRDAEGALPLLQFTLDQLFERREGRLLTRAAYTSLGGVRGALTKHAEETYAALPTEHHRASARLLFLRLVEPGASEQEMTRRRVPLSELALADPLQANLLREVVAAFVHARLLTANEVASVGTVEVSHEALLRSWPRLRGWIDEDRAGLRVHRRLTEAAQEWQRLGRDDSILYRGSHLDEALGWRDRNPAAPNEMEGRFLSASVGVRERERAARERLRRRIIAGLGAGLAAAIALAVVAMAFAGFALVERQRAEKQTRVAMDGRLAAWAAVVRNRDTRLLQQSVLLSLEALRRAPSPEAEETLRNGLYLLPRPVKELTYEGRVNDVNWSLDRRFFAAGSADGTTVVWEIPAGREVARVHSEGTQLFQALSPDGHYLGAAADDGTARMWELPGGKEVARMKYDASGAPDGSMPRVTVSFSPDRRYFALATGDGRAWIWEVPSGKEYWRIGADNEPSTDQSSYILLFSPDGRYLPTAQADGSVEVWNVAERKLATTVKHDDQVMSVAFSPGSSSAYLATASTDNTAKIWELPSGKLAFQMKFNSWVKHVEFSPDGRYVAAGSYDFGVQVWDVASRRQVSRMQHDGEIWHFTFSPDGRYLATASLDHTVRVWDVSSGVEMARTTQEDYAWGVLFAQDARHLVTVAGEKGFSAEVWELTNGGEAARWDASGEVRRLDFGSGGRSLVTSSVSKDVRTVRTQAIDGTQKPVEIKLDDGNLAATYYTADGHYLATTHKDGNVRAWDLSTGAEVAHVNPDVAVSRVSLSEDGRLLVALDGNKTTRVWELPGVKERPRLVHEEKAWGLYLSRDGRYATTASGDRTMVKWDLSTGREVSRVRADEPIERVVFGSDGRYIASLAADGTVSVFEFGQGNGRRVGGLEPERGTAEILFTADDNHLAVVGANLVEVWRIPSLERVMRVSLPTFVSTMTFSADGRYLAAAGRDGVTVIWEVNSGREVGRTRFVKEYGAIALSPDGRYLAADSVDGTVRVWLLQLDDLKADACRHLTRNLTPEEWRKYVGNERYRQTCSNLP